MIANRPSAIALEPLRRNSAIREMLTWFCVVLLCVVILALLARPAAAAELAILRNGFSIRHEHRLVMGATTRLYLSADDSSFTDVPTEEIASYEKELLLPVTPADSATATDSAKLDLTKFLPLKSVPANATAPLPEVVASASAAFHLDPDLVNSVIHAESGFNSRAVSPKGARGLMQLMPATAYQLGVYDSFDPKANVTGGSRYLRELLERYNFDLVKALAAYNAGPERVEQYNGVPPFYETRAYVARIVREYNRKKVAQEHTAASQARKDKDKGVSASTARTRSNSKRAPQPASQLASNSTTNSSR